ncbi:MAG: hypothetical protein ABW133_24780 [Polyangiaceae bacterium]
MPRATYLFASTFALLLGIAAPVDAADPTIAECLTANDKSIQLRSDHKLLAARKELLVCAASTCPAEVRKECMRRIDLVNSSLPTVVIEAKDGSGNDLVAVKVTMDGDVLTEKLDGSALSMDPGAHTFTFEVAGQPPVTKQLVIREGQKDRREVLQLGAAPAATPATTATPSAKPANPAIETSVDQVSSSSGSTQKTLALVAGGVGVVGVAVGSIFGLQSMSKHSEAEEKCPGACANQAGVDLWDDARSAGNISTIAFAVGGVGLATGAILWFTAKPSKSSTMHAHIGPGSVQIRGTW